jgi:superfamily II DNA helicase RecQ
MAVADIPGLRTRIADAEISPDQVEARLRAVAAAAGPDGEIELAPGALDDRGLFEMAMATRVGAFERTSGPGAGMRGRVVSTSLDPAARSALAREVAAEILRRRQALRAIVDYAGRPACRRAALLAHFGDASRPAPEGRCCDVCDPFDVSAYLPAPGARSAAPRGHGMPPGGADHRAGRSRRAVFTSEQAARLARLLAWREAEVHRLGWPAHRLVSHALLEDVARAGPRTEAALAAAGVPRRLVERYSRPLLLAVSGGGAAPGGEPAPIDAALWEALRSWRRERANGSPAYTVASDRTLEEIAHAMPRTARELASIRGVGPAFLERHAESLLTLLHGTRAHRSGVSTPR